MTDRIDQEGRATFVQTLPRKVTELRATLGTLVADPRSQRMRDELRRRLHALYTLPARSYSLPTLSEGLREGSAHLDAVRGACVLGQRDLESLADLVATLPALAQRDLPDQPQLVPGPARRRASRRSRPGRRDWLRRPPRRPSPRTSKASADAGAREAAQRASIPPPHRPRWRRAIRAPSREYLILPSVARPALRRPRPPRAHRIRRLGSPSSSATATAATGLRCPSECSWPAVPASRAR